MDEFACLINTHANLPLTEDTADSVKYWMTPNILILVDGLGWDQFENKTNYQILKGFNHGYPCSPYRNILHGLTEIYKMYPKVRWYCYLESDCLIANDRFKKDLINSKFIGGLEYRYDYSLNLPLLDEIVKDSVNKHHHLLGCVLFMSHTFVETLMSEDIPNKIINATADLPVGTFPDFHGLAFEETLFPSLSAYYAEDSVFSLGEWSKYNVRWCPEITEKEVTASATIIHPIKNINSKIRQHYRKFRKQKS